MDRTGKIPGNLADVPQTQPGSMLVRAINNPQKEQVWMYHPYPKPSQIIIGTLEAIDQLTAKGWQEAPAIYQTPLFTQLYDTIRVQSPSTGEHTLWAHQDAVASVERYPVALVSVIGINQELIDTLAVTLAGKLSIPMLSPLPPPTSGIAGFILDLYNPDAPQLTGYSISSLPDEVQERFRRSCTLLCKIASPDTNHWRPQTSLHRIALDQVACQHTLNSLRARERLAQGKTLLEVRMQRAELEQAMQEVHQVRTMQQKPSYESDMKEVRQLMQDLARDYYKYYQANINRDNQPIPEIAHAFNANGMAKMFSCLPVQAYTVATTAPVEAWNTYSSDKENELILGFPVKKPSGLYHILMKEDTTGQDREIVLARMKKSIENMGDYDSDLFMMMVLQLIVGRRNENGNVVMSAHKALEYHNTVAKKNPKDQYGTRTGGPRWEDLEKWSASYLRMRNQWMKLDSVEIIDDESKPDRRGRRKRTTINREAPLFMFDEIITHETLPLSGGASKKIVVAWEYREATWMLPFTKGSNVYTSGILQDCFTFDPYHETWEKRLSKHFFFWLRTNATHKEPPLIRIRDLFSELHLEINKRNPARTRERFEQAMNVLAGEIPRTTTKQKVFKPHLQWSYADTYEFPRKNWLETWLSLQIAVTPPAVNPNAHILAAAQTRREQIQAQQIKVEAANAKKRGRPSGSKNKK